MAMTATISAGADAAYPFRSMGGSEQSATGEKGGTEYYLSASREGGEPDGKWVGEGLADLGIHDGQAITKDDEDLFRQIYSEFLDVRDPSGQTPLGKAPRESSQAERMYQEKLAAEPGATAERKQELRYQARAEAPTGTVRFWDNTLSVDKTITLAHAAALAAAKEAREAGDNDAARMWEARAAGVWEEIGKAVKVYIDHQQQEAGYVRPGHHGARVGDAEAGRFERAHDIPVAAFAQHTSRNGDPHLHVHTLWLNRVKTVSDGQWRAVDSRALHRNKQEAAAKAAFSLESALTRRFGFEWAYREESKGRVLTAVPQKTAKEFSSRRAEVSAETGRLREKYREEYGHEPSQRVLRSLGNEAFYATRNSKEGKLEMDAKLREWEDKSRAAELGSLRDLAQDIWGTLSGAAQDAAQKDAAQDDGAWRTAHRALTPDEERAAMATGLARIQQEKSTWSRQELVRSIAQSLPNHATAASSEEAVRYLDSLADRTLRGEAGEPARRLDAPEWPRVPDSMRRADGESIYTPHGAAKYATEGQLSMEGRILSRAQEKTGTRLDAETAARLLGADPAQLEAQLRGAADAAHAAQDPDARTANGLRLDQATAAYLALTSDRRVEAIVGPAGSGKSTVARQLEDAWKAGGGGKVYGLTMSSAGRNVLTEKGLQDTRNTAQFLGHLPGEREARGVEDAGERAMIIVDESTQVSMPDIDSILRHANAKDTKVVMIGDPAQLPAVESGGGFEMITRQLGFSQLNEAARFRHQWEGDASLKLRDGELQALAEYDAHGRLHAGTHEDMTEQTVRDYLADHLAGKSTIATALRNADRDELNRRTQQYLREWGKLDTSISARLADDLAAHPGDLIRATDNNNKMAADQGRTVSNGDIMRVVSIGERGITVERQAGTDAKTGGTMWSQPYDLPLSYIAEHADLGYARTNHGVMGDTVTSGAALVSDKDQLSALYPATTRGREENHVNVYDSASFASGRWAQGQGVKPAPELQRHDRLEAERAGENPDRASGDYDAVNMLAKVQRNNERELSATEYRDRALGNADHLGLLGHILGEQVREESAARFTSALRETLGEERTADALKDTDDLWRALRAAELAGKDGPQVLREAAAQRGLEGARSVPAVLTQRVRDLTEDLPPAPRESWLSRVPQTDDPDKQRYLTEVAQAMDNRQVRLGQHAAGHPPLWATQALGDVPEDPDKRAEWEQKAGKIGAYREQHGWDHPGQAIGPEPNTTSPEARSEWHNALVALEKFDGIDVRGLTDGQLMLRRDAYERETSWAPKYVAGELRLARLAGHNSKVEQSRHRHEADAADNRGDQDRADLHRQAAASFLALGARSADMEAKLEEAQETRTAWERITEPTLRLAQASDAELHRRGVLGPDDKLNSAEPEGFKYPEPEPQQNARDEEKPPTRAQTEHRQMSALGLTRDDDGDPAVSRQVDEIAAHNREQQAKIDQLLSLRQPAEHEDEIDLGNPWAALAARERDAVIQPPKPDIPAAEPVMEAARERDLEAGGNEMSLAGNILGGTLRTEGQRRAMPIQDIYLLTLHEPYEAPEHPVPINATIVHARTLLHPAVPQPDSGRMYRCLTEFPARADGDIVPLSTLTFELNGGQLWSEIADWQAVVAAIVRLARDRHCDAMPLGLLQWQAAILAHGPTTVVNLYQAGRGRSVLTPRDRQQCLVELSAHLGAFVAQGPFWPGSDLVEPPTHPATMPWRPYGS